MEQALIFVDVKDEADVLLGQTGLDGCLSFTHSKEELVVVITHLNYAPLRTTLRASEKQTLPLASVKLLEGSGANTHRGVVSSAEFDPALARTKAGKYRYSGVILDQESGDPLTGANVQIKGSSEGTITDLDGRYEFNRDEAKVELIISYTGYNSLETPSRPGEHLTIHLAAAAVLEEVVVIGSRGRVAGRPLGISRTRSRAKRSEAAMPPPPPVTPMAEGLSLEDRVAAYDPETYEERVEVRPDSGKGMETPHKGADQLPSAGQLTAGEVNDFSKWELWSDISEEDLGRHRGTWQQFADHRYTLQLINEAGAAVINAAVELVDGQANILWRARTDAQGRAELWAHYFQEVDQAANGLRIRARVAGKVFELPEVKPFHRGVNFLTIAADCVDQPIVDLAFVVDATGSMGDEINYLQAELLDVIQRAKDSLTGVDLQLGSVFYRDLSDEYLTRHHDLSANFAATVEFVQKQSADGGGDGPEAVEDALEVALDKLHWRDHATTRLLFLVLDAPPHQAAQNVKRMQLATARAAARGIQIIPVACSGIDKSTEYLMRAMALATNGTYTFLTDHSGIGNKHIEPSTDSYEVEYLNDVLLRLLIARSKLLSCQTSEPPVAVDLPQVPQEPTEHSWSCYPNPTSGPLTVLSAGTAKEGFLLDSNGKLLQRFAVQDRFQLDMSTYPAGQYWLKIGQETAAQSVVLLRY